MLVGGPGRTRFGQRRKPSSVKATWSVSLSSDCIGRQAELATVECRQSVWFRTMALTMVSSLWATAIRATLAPPAATAHALTYQHHDATAGRVQRGCFGGTSTATCEPRLPTSLLGPS